MFHLKHVQVSHEPFRSPTVTEESHLPLGPQPHFELTLRKIDPKMSTNYKEQSVFEDYKNGQVRIIVLESQQVLSEWISAIN